MKHQLFEVSFAAMIVVSAINKRQALDKATRILDNNLLYPTNVRKTIIYPDIMDYAELDEPKPVEEPGKDEPIPF